MELHSAAEDQPTPPVDAGSNSTLQRSWLATMIAATPANSISAVRQPNPKKQRRPSRYGRIGVDAWRGGGRLWQRKGWTPLGGTCSRDLTHRWLSTEDFGELGRQVAVLLCDEGALAEEVMQSGDGLGALHGNGVWPLRRPVEPSTEFA